MSVSVSSHYPIYHRDRIIMDEERVLSAIEEAGCELSRVGMADYLKNNLATGQMSRSSEAASSASRAARYDNRL